MSLFTVIPQGPFESKCRKQLSLSSCGWVLIRSGQFIITPSTGYSGACSGSMCFANKSPVACNSLAFQQPRGNRRRRLHASDANQLSTPGFCRRGRYKITTPTKAVKIEAKNPSPASSFSNLIVSLMTLRRLGAVQAQRRHSVTSCCPRWRCTATTLAAPHRRGKIRTCSSTADQNQTKHGREQRQMSWNAKARKDKHVIKYGRSEQSRARKGTEANVLVR